MNYNELLNIGLEASIKSGEKIMEVYENTKNIKYEKKSDNSPLTIADKKSHNIINTFLKKTKLNIISEESNVRDFKIRKNWKYYWLVDPLDGTKEFIKKNGEFTVNIALVKKNKPIVFLDATFPYSTRTYKEQGVVVINDFLKIYPEFRELVQKNYDGRN